MEITRSNYRELTLGLAAQYLACKTADEREAFLVSVYNLHQPLPRGVKATTSMAWCAIFVSAIAQMLQFTDIVPFEMGVWEMTQIAKQMGIWKTRSNYTPKTGDIIVYDWLKDDGHGGKKQDGNPDHVGYVEDVGENYVTAIEGNCNGGTCARRTSSLTDVQIYGYIAPNYEAKEQNRPKDDPKHAPGGAEAFDAKLDGNYRVTTALYLRSGAGITNRIVATMPKNAVVSCYGYYSVKNGTPWLYLNFGNVSGFASSKYLNKL